MSDSSLPKVNGSRGGEDSSRPSTTASNPEGEMKFPAISSARGSSRDLKGSSKDLTANAGGTSDRGGDKGESPGANETNEDGDDPIAVLGSKDASQLAEKKEKKSVSKLHSRRDSQERPPPCSVSVYFGSRIW
ncbi:hypothetical protein T484DRAFT_1827269 [Baffinella frigidus]|nr:hypothetical protein T484DRAFT_1827269 [Cryptophyta sp. CCMP2293]